jgi:succinoglycan biosynthesis transport protein ExoP
MGPGAIDHPYSPVRSSWPQGLSAGLAMSLFHRRPIFLATWLLLGMTVVCGLIYNLTPAYQATAEVALDSRLRRPDDYGSVVSGPFTLTDYAPIVRSELRVLESPALAGRVIDELHLINVEEFWGGRGFRSRLTASFTSLAARFLPESVIAMFAWQQPKSDPATRRALLLEEYARRLSVSNDGRSLTIVVKVWAADPALAATIANTHVQLYIQDQIALKESSSRRAVDWIGEQLKRLGSDLKAKEDELSEFREHKGLVHAMGSTLIAQQAAQIADRLSQARTELAQKQATAAQLRHEGASGADVQSPVLNSLLVQHLRQQESELNAQLEQLRSRYLDSGPVVRTVESQIAGVHKKIAQETARIVTSLTADADVAQSRVNDLSGQLASLRKQLVSEDRSDVRVAEMERDIVSQSGVYRELMSRQQQIASQIGAAQADARFIAPAAAPRLPFYPMYALFFLLGLVGVSTSGLGGAYLLERMRKGVEELDEIPSARGIMHFQSIPFVAASQLRGGSLPDYLLEVPLGVFADSIRSLRGDLMLSARSPVPRVLALTSALPGEGKTTIAVSIGRSMAVAGLQVLLIDCDLRRPRCAELVGAKSYGTGLISRLLGRSSLDDAVIADPLSSLKLLVPEEPALSPQDLLGSALVRVIDDAKGHYDVVILDTPPVEAVTDAFLVTQLADAVVLSVRWRSTAAAVVEGVISAFQERRVPISGVFLNGVNFKQAAMNKGQADIYKAVKSYYPAG